MKRVVFVFASFISSAPVFAQVQVFRNDYQGFLGAAGPLSSIGFEILPDGTPSDGHVGTPITSDFNYDLYGAHFTAGVGNPTISGGAQGQFGLMTFTSVNGPHTWLTAGLTNPGHAVGIFYGGHTTLCAYDSTGTQLGCGTYAGGDSLFLGIVSSTPIARAVIDRGSFGEAIDSLIFSSIPEPSTAGLVAIGSLLVFRRRREGSRAYKSPTGSQASELIRPN